MSDIESFFSEQEERMEMPNEDFEEYLSRTSQKHALYRVDNRRTSSLITAAAPVPHAAQIGRGSVTCSLPLTGSMGPCVAPTSPDTVIMDERTISSSVKRKLSEIISTSSDAVKRPKVVRGHEDTVCNPSAQIQDDSGMQTFSGRHRDKNSNVMNLTHVHTHLEDPTKISKVPVAAIASASQSNESEHRQMVPISLKELEHIGSAKPFPSLPKSHQTTCVHRHGTGDMIPEPSGSHQSTTPVRWDVVAPAPMAADENLSEKMKLSSQARGRKGGHGDKMPEMPQAKVCTANSSNVTTPPSSAHAEAAPPLPAVVGPAARNATTGKQKVVGTTTEKAKAKRKEKELITPLEYAQRLQAKFAEAGRPSGSSYLKGKRIFYFSNDMLYASAETRGRMDFITKHGGMLIPEYDPAQVTHVVTDASKRLLLRALGLKSLDMIPNHIPTVKWSWVISGLERYRRKRAAKVQEKTKMAAAGDGTSNTTTQPEAEEEEEVKMDHELMHASFHERIDAGPPLWPNKQNQQKQKKKQLVHQANGSGGQIGSPDMNGGQGSGELSAISEFTQDGIGSRQTLSSGRFGPSISPPLFPRILHVGGQAVSTIDQIDEPLKIAGPSSLMKGTSGIGARILSAADPLAEFYEQARAERNAEALHGQPGDEGSDDETDLKRNHTHAVNHGAHKKRAFLCDTKTNGQLAQCPNQDVIDKLEELMELHKAKPSEEDRWRVFSYGKAIRALRSYPSRIKSRQEARAIRGVGDKTAQKIMEILETGNLQRIGYEKTDDVRAITLFQGIYGVGRNTAFKWFSSGCRTLEDIEARKGGIKLSSVQKIGLKYYADINSRMPRSEAADIFNLIKPIALDIDPRLFIEIMGSYRRGKADCGDIDILITRPTDDGKTHQGVLRRLLGELHRQGILTEDLCIPDNFEDLELVYRGLCRRDVNGMRRRIDFLAVPYESRGAALLYYTGDDIFNRSLRLKANVMGYSLNQRGLFAGVIRNPSDRRQKLDGGFIIASETEREILDVLGVPWQEPHERVRN